MNVPKILSVAPQANPERTQRPLKLQNVMPVKMRHAQIQRTIAQRERGVNQSRPHAIIDLVGHGNVSLPAERANGGGGRLAERSVNARRSQRAPIVAKRCCIAFDGRTGVMSLNGIHACHGSVPRRASLLGSRRGSS